MAIIIPSKNVFEIDNSIIIDNAISSIEVASKKPRTFREYSTEVHTVNNIDSSDTYIKSLMANFWEFANAYGDIGNNLFVYKSVKHYYVLGSFCGIIPMYKTISFEIPKKSEYSMITNIFSGNNDNGEPKIQTTVRYDYRETDNFALTVVPTYNESTSQGSASSTLVPIGGFTPTVQAANYISNSATLAASANFKTVDGSDFSSYSVVNNQQNISNASISYNEETGNYTISLTILSGLTTCRGAIGSSLQDDGAGNYSGGGVDLGTSLPSSKDFSAPSDNFKGRWGEYKPVSIDVSFFGNKISFKVDDEILKIGDGSSIISVDANELVQPSNYILEDDASKTPAIKNDFSNTIEQYKEGKQIVTVTCSIDDYYDENGNLAISKTNENGKMAFDLYDEVVPMVKDVRNFDSPISTMPNGDAKTFYVLGKTLFYDGSVLQKLYLQQKSSAVLGNSYALKFSPYAEGIVEFSIQLYIQGTGQIYINDQLVSSVDYKERTLWKHKLNDNQIISVKFVGLFDEISTSVEVVSEGNLPRGEIHDVLHWYAKMFPYMFYYQDVSIFKPKIPEYIKTIPKSSFEGVTYKGNYALEIPKSIKKIEGFAFAYSELNEFIFKQDAYQLIILPIAGNATGMFYTKNAKNIKIYTDNIAIKNYDYKSDNVTPTFYHLDGTLWE